MQIICLEKKHVLAFFFFFLNEQNILKQAKRALKHTAVCWLIVSDVQFWANIC